MSFIDEVNKARPRYVSPQETYQMMQQKEMQELYELVQKIAAAAKSMIIDSAKRVSRGQNFSFEGFILHKWPNSDTKYIHAETAARKSFFSSAGTQDITFFPTEKAVRFYELLRTALMKDSVVLNEYKLMFSRRPMGEYPNLGISHTLDDFILIAGDSGSELLSPDDRYPLPCTWHIGNFMGERYDSVMVGSRKVCECRGNMSGNGIYLCLSFTFRG